MDKLKVQENLEVGSDADTIEEEYEIVEHEQAHAVVMARENVGVSHYLHEEEGWGQTQPQERLCEPFLNNFSGMIDHRNLRSILEEQNHMLSALEISNEKLASLNSISEKNFQAFSMEFKHQTHTLLVMKKQLDSCFRRIRSLKSKLAIQYPEAFQAAIAQCQIKDDI